MPREKLTFTSRQGHTLAAALEVPSQPAQAYAIFVHCFTCSKDIAAASRIARALSDKGIAVLRFDFTGLGNSDGDFANTNFSSNLEDLIEAANYLNTHYEAPSILIGHSLGGAAVLAAAQQIDSVKAVVTIAAPATGKHIEHLFTDHAEEIIANDEAMVDLAGRRFRIKRQFLEDVARFNDTEHIVRLNKALLIFHSPLDSMVPVSEASKIYRAAKHPKSFITLDQADHLLTQHKDADYVATMIASWLGRYIDLSPPKPAPSGLNKSEVRVSEMNHVFTCRVQSSDHNLVADEPESFGGNNLGPSPFEYLMASLGACTVMTIRMVAEREDLPLQDVDVVLSNQLVPISDAPDERRKALLIERRITLLGRLSKTQHQRLMQVADRCPVHKALNGEVRIRTISNPN